MELKPAATGKEPKERSGFEIELEQRVQGLLEPDEKLLGATVASQQKGLFSGGVATLVVTDRRLIVQPMDRRGRTVKGEPTSITQSELTKVKVRRAGAGDSASSLIMSGVAITVKIKTTGGEKFQFSLMDGGGSAILGKLGGGPLQQQAVQALRVFLGEDGASVI